MSIKDTVKRAIRKVAEVVNPVKTEEPAQVLAIPYIQRLTIVGIGFQQMAKGNRSFKRRGARNIAQKRHNNKKRRA